MIVNAISFGMEHRRMPEPLAYESGHIAVTNVWIDCKMGVSTADTRDDFWGLVVEEMRRAKPWANRNIISLDAPISTIDGELDRHSSGRTGYLPPSQLITIQLSEVFDAIENLPDEYGGIMRCLAMGDTAEEIARADRIPIHTLLKKIRHARRFLGEA